MNQTHPTNLSVNSASAIPPVPRSLSDSKVAASTPIETACDQFNAGDFFACHETLEPLWLAAAGTERTYWHALIQAAVALLHHERGNLKGAISVYHRAANKLSALPHGYGACDVESLLTDLREFFAQSDNQTNFPYPMVKMR